MSDYTQIEDFSAKDALASGDPEKIISGADIDAELAAIATAIATKANSASPTLTGTITISGATVAGNATFSGGNTHSGANTFSGNNTFSGTNTFSGGNTHSGNNTLSGDNDIKDTLEIYDPDDTTKKVRFDAGSITTGTTRVITIPDRDLTLGMATGAYTASTSGSAIDFTSIPSWAREISISFVGVSTNGTGAIVVQIGDSGGIEATGYSGAGWNAANAGAVSVAANSTGFRIHDSAAAAGVYHGTYTLTLADSATNTWTFSGNGARSDTAAMQGGGGSKALSATLDRVRIATSDTFDAGNLNVTIKG